MASNPNYPYFIKEDTGLHKVEQYAAVLGSLRLLAFLKIIHIFHINDLNTSKSSTELS